MIIHSIRKFLLINLLLSITITTTLTVIGNYILDQKDIQHHLDSLLTQAGLSFQSLIGNNLDQANLKRIQQQLNNVPTLAKKHHTLLENPFGYTYEDKFQFQVWDQGGHLLIHSANAPLTPLSNFTEGFSITKVHNHPWRVFTTINAINQSITMVAEPYDVREQLGRRITQDDIYIMLLATPLLGLLIWVIVGKGLKPLQRVTREVSHRAASYLEPVDLTAVPEEIRSLIDELNRLFKRLQQAFEREKRFSGDAAHELRTPLAVLKAQAQVALRSKNDNERLQALEKLMTGVDRSTHVVQQLLTLAHLVPDQGYAPEDLEFIKLHTIAVDEIIQIAPTALEKKIEIELQCPDESITIKGNSIAIGILMRNLIDNAIRYTPENNHVAVIIKLANGSPQLQVIDNGPGIPEELRSRVFERFFRIIGNKAKGSGLGLAIVHQIVELHHAKIELDTPASGKGLAVTVTFPIN